jgi:hypothetical protein
MSRSIKAGKVSNDIKNALRVNSNKIARSITEKMTKMDSNDIKLYINAMYVSFSMGNNIPNEFKNNPNIYTAIIALETIIEKICSTTSPETKKRTPLCPLPNLTPMPSESVVEEEAPPTVATVTGTTSPPAVDVNTLAWWIPRDWDPDIDCSIPINDKASLYLLPFVTGMTEPFTILLASSVSNGIGLALQRHREGYAKPPGGAGWKPRDWIEPTTPEHVLRVLQHADNDVFSGYALNFSGEALEGSANTILDIVTSRSRCGANISVIINVWHSAADTAILAIRRLSRNFLDKKGAMHYDTLYFPNLSETLGGIGLPPPVVADIGKQNEEIITRLNEGTFNVEAEVNFLRKRRRVGERDWLSLLKLHARRREGDGWIAGLRAALPICEDALEWLSAVDPLKFEKASFALSLTNQEISDLAWYIFLFLRRPEIRNRQLWETALNDLLENNPNSASTAALIRALRDNEDMTDGYIDFADILRWVRTIPDDYTKAREYCDGKREYLWPLMVSGKAGIDEIARAFSLPNQLKYADLILNSRPSTNNEPSLEDQTVILRGYIRPFDLLRYGGNRT